MIALALLVLAAAPQEPPVTYASADDCAIIVEVGKSQAAWGPQGPDRPFVIDGLDAEGGVYRQQCDWEALGVGAPTPARTDRPGSWFAIERPSYGADGTTAETAINSIAWAGPGRAPFIAMSICTLRKDGGRWRLVGCELGLIT